MQYLLLLFLGLSIFTCHATRNKSKTPSPIDSKLVAKQVKEKTTLYKKSKSISKATIQQRALHYQLYIDAFEGLMLLRVGDNRKSFTEWYNKKYES